MSSEQCNLLRTFWLTILNYLVVAMCMLHQSPSQIKQAPYVRSARLGESKTPSPSPMLGRELQPADAAHATRLTNLPLQMMHWQREVPLTEEESGVILFYFIFPRQNLNSSSAINEKIYYKKSFATFSSCISPLQRIPVLLWGSPVCGSTTTLPATGE